MVRVVLITGCSSGGIGYSLCEQFALQGCKVYATARNIAKIADFGAGYGSSIEKFALDVNNDESVKRCIDHIVEKEGKIDVLVNNAGVTSPGPLIEVPLDDIKEVFETNVFAVIRMSRAVARVMAKQKSGLIVNIGSIVGEVSTPWSGVYCASKAAVNSVSEVLSMELSTLNIKVLHVAPGGVKSHIADNGSSRFQLAPDSMFASYLPMIQKRIATSQGPDSIPSEVFAKEVVKNALKETPPRYMTLGGKATFFQFLKWLPRGYVLNMVWRTFSDKATA
ncbi:hypothetical protein D9613_002174 [Agrocybe pediades]|uniref:Ketoreductase domain-containing protein n=1 Tax=Agrocybe pediades TaxID=84607 RepID=A0A8H4R574_9AGAR|nr:hypothetical protein D9613_002174 [Agrocybe pediades]